MMTKTAITDDHGISGRLPAKLAGLILLLIMVFSALIRYGLLEAPFERDEGEYAYAGQLMLQGIPPYQELYNMKLPGIYAVYAGIMAIFGQTHIAVHLGLLLFNSATILVIFLLGRRLLGPLTGLIAAASFATLSLSPSVQGVFANAEHFVILPALGGLLLLLKSLDDDRPSAVSLMASGFLLGTGLVIKQHGAAFVALGGTYYLMDRICSGNRDWKRILKGGLWFLSGAILPYGLTCIILAAAGVFDRFWFWTVQYASAYATLTTLDQALTELKDSVLPILTSSPLIWIFSAIGIVAIFRDTRIRQRRLFLLLFSLFSVAAVCPGFYFRQHYFILLLPAASLLAGIGISFPLAGLVSRTQSQRQRPGIALLIALICMAGSIFQQRQFLFQLSPAEATSSIYWPNPFAESIAISEFIRNRTGPDDKIAIIGSEPQIFFYAQRHSATGYIYMYPLMERHDFALAMQKELIQEVEKARPKMLLFVNVQYSWLREPDSHSLLFKWFQDYNKKYYQRIGLVEIFSDTTRYSLGSDEMKPPGTPFWVEIMERVPTP